MATSYRYLPSLVAVVASLVAAACPSAPPRTMGSLCVPGNQQCSENRFETCASDGASWVTSIDCGEQDLLCFPQVGCKKCSPGALQCGGDGFDIVRCSGDGDSLQTLGRCEPENGELCSGEGTCENACDVTRAQRSYEGCEYWAVDLDNAVTNDLGPAAAQQYSIVITNPLEIPASVKVEVNDAPPGEPPILREVASTFLDRVVGGGDLKTINLDAREVDCSTDPRRNDGSGTCLSSHAFHITSTAPIVAYQFNPLENVAVFSNDASLLLPQSALGQDYLVLSWPQTLAITSESATNGGTNLRAFLTIVGSEEATGVSVRLSTSTLPGNGIPAGHAGDELQFTLGPFDVVNLETDGFMADFTGSQIKASKPIAVFTGSEASDAPLFTTLATRDCCADHLEEQLFPETAFGHTYVATKSPRRSFYVHTAGWDVAVNETEPEDWRILATVGEFSSGTLVHTNLPPPNDEISLGRGQFVTLESGRDFVIWSDKPIAVGQLQTGQQTTGIPTTTPSGQRIPGGDPSFTVLPPVEQWKSKYVFLVPNKYHFDFLLIGMPKGTEILYDNLPLEEALPRCE
jgi:hypothetical protein